MILSALTPYQMLHRMARVQAGQSMLIHGAGGSVGTATLQLAPDAGITAFGTGVAAKHGLIRSFGRQAIDAGAADPGAAIAEAVGEGGCRFRPPGRQEPGLARSLEALKPGGGMLEAFGFINELLGRGGSIPFDLLRLKLWEWLPTRLATAFYSIGAMRRRQPDWFKGDLAALFAMLSAGRLTPAIAEVLPLAEVRRAHEGVPGAIV